MYVNLTIEHPKSVIKSAFLGCFYLQKKMVKHLEKWYN